MKDRLKLIMVALFLLLFVPTGAVAMSSGEVELEIYHPTITVVQGVVLVKGVKYPAWEEAREGMLLLSGDTLKTENGAFARIEFPSGELEIYETTVVVLPSIGVLERKKDIREVIINEGKTLFDIKPLGVERGFQFRTKNIQGGVKGTVFTVSYLEGGTAVNVYRGVVEISDLERTRETNVELTAGMSVRVEKNTDIGKIKSFDPSVALKDYQYRIPPGLTGKGLPADHRANPDNKGIRNRGKGKPGSSDDSSEVDSGDDSDNDQGDNDQGDNEQ